MATPVPRSTQREPVEDWRRYRLLLALGVFASGLLPVVASIADELSIFRLGPGRAVAVTLVAMLYSAALYAAARFITRSVPTAVVFVITWSYAVFIYPDLPVSARIGGWPQVVSAPLYLTVVGLVCGILWLRRRVTDYLAVPLSLCAVVSLLAGALQIAPPYFHSSFHVPLAPLADPDALHAEGRPNIYHLVLDEMGREDVLRERYGVDISDVESSLSGLGFTIERGAVANYAQTALSIPSILNANYLDLPAGTAGEVSQVPLQEAVQDNVVFSTLREAGYDIVFLASDYSATANNVQATTCRCPPVSFGDFEAGIISRTPFRAIWPGDFDYLPHRHRVERTLDAFAASASVRSHSPRYTFAHVISPHPPFIFKADGTFAPPRRVFTMSDGSMYPGTAAEYREGYAQQVSYIVRRAAAAASAVIARDPTAVVIISGDHGPRLGFSALDAQLTNATEVLPVFLAIRWGGDTSAVPPVDTLVNIYRAVLNRYLGTTLPMLQRRSYVSPFFHPYDLLERAVR